MIAQLHTQRIPFTAERFLRILKIIVHKSQPEGAQTVCVCVALTSHFAFLDILSQASRQSLCTNLMLPEHLQGWNKGLPSSSSHLHILQTDSWSWSMTSFMQGWSTGYRPA